MDTSDIAIKVSNISKCYRIGMKEQVSGNFATSFFNFLKSPVSNFRKYRSLYKFDDIEMSNGKALDNGKGDIIWALRNVSFDVKKGEVLGIVGKNGAGKSTLLKILSRITDPTRGRAEIRGRVSSLLEVGTGFHPELTGRENIYLNGTILGMRKKELDRKLDEILDFSGIEKFADTPVKRYSSGMKVRLAFSVAAHLEPEILIIDEVLAVGDADFQEKCLNKMEDVGKSGRTVIFVSHNMSAVKHLCSRVLLLQNATVTMDGPPQDVINAYLKPERGMVSSLEWRNMEDAPGDEIVRFRSVALKSQERKDFEFINVSQPVTIEIRYRIFESGHILKPYIYFLDQTGKAIFASFDQHPEWVEQRREPGEYLSTMQVPANFLAPGMILVNFYIMNAKTGKQHAMVRGEIAFEAVESNLKNSARGDYTGKIYGVVRPLFEWKTRRVPAAMSGRPPQMEEKDARASL